MEAQITVSIDLASLLLAHATAQGLSTDKILTAAGLDPRLFKDRETRLPLEQYQSLWLAAAEQSGDPDFGLHFGEAARYFPPGHLLGTMMMNSPTVGEALERFFRFHGLMSEAVAPRMENAGQRSCVVLEQPTTAPQLDRHLNEANVSAILTFLRGLCEHWVQPLEVEFTHSSPTDTAEHERVFACPLHWDMPKNQFWIPSDVLTRPLPHADPELLQVMEKVAGERLERTSASSNWARRVEHSIVQTLLAGGKPAVEEVARDLAVSRRLLQGKLKDEGTTYQQTLDRVRKELAVDYLEQEDLSLCEIAFLLGFADQTSFNHAFKRWTGSKPGAHRGSSQHPGNKPKRARH